MSTQPAADLPPQGPTDHLELVRTAWKEVLGVEEVGDDVTFFDAGGDSLRLVVLVERLNHGSPRMLRTVDVFRAGTVRGHAALFHEPVEAPAPAGRRSGSRQWLLDAARARAARAE